MDNLCKLGFITSEFLLKGKDIKGRYAGVEIGIILMNSSSSLDTDRNHQKSISSRDDYFPSPSVFVYTLPNVVIGEICIRHNIHGEGNFFITEKFNPRFMFDYVSQLFDNDFVKCCITGWVEMNGSNVMLDLHLSDEIIVRIRTHRGVSYSIGSKIHFDLDPQMVRFFNPATEAALVTE
jgi:hypothetical protein